MNDLSLKEFIDSFSTSTEPASTLQTEHFLSSIQEYSVIKDPTTTLQVLVFIAGYTVYSYFKNSARCHSCLSFLTEDKEMEIEASPESIYKLLQVMDRGALKWPSSIVIQVLVCMWKIFTSIEQQPKLFQELIEGPSRRILVNLTLRVLKDEESEYWRNKCPNCHTIGWDILNTLITTGANCFLSNKVKNLNALHRLEVENTRKLKKFKSI